MTSHKLKVALVFGTRPEAIKMAPLALALNSESSLDTRIVVTGQHRQMLDQVLDLFALKPDQDLNLMQHGQSLSGLTSRAITALEAAFAADRPDLVLVHGDTTTTMVASLSAFYHQIPVGHVEAGLRTGDIWAPWPEEVNRQIVGRIASMHFAPTERARQNLLCEGVDDAKIFVTGNTVIDALQWVTARLEKAAEEGALELASLMVQNVAGALPAPATMQALQQIVEGDARMVLITGHRRENLGEGFRNICNALNRLADDFPEVHFVYPVHLNPRVQAPVNELLGTVKNIHLISPLDYLPFTFLMNHSTLVLTDSGGIQEEAPGLGKPVLVMRDVTERPEGVDAGTVKLVGTCQDAIYDGVARLLTDPEHYASMAEANNPFGDGRACQRIIEAISAWHKNTERGDS